MPVGLDVGVSQGLLPFNSCLLRGLDVKSQWLGCTRTYDCEGL
jgi:hypothetical protein